MRILEFIDEMEFHQKQIEYKTTSTSELVFNELLAKNLSKRFESSQNLMIRKPLHKDADKFLEAPCYNMIEDLSKSKVLDWEKLTSSVIDSIESKKQTDWKEIKFNCNLKNCGNENDIFLKYPSENEFRTITNLQAQNLNLSFIRDSISKHNGLVTSKSGSMYEKKTVKLLQKSELLNRSLLIEGTNSSSTNVNLVTDFKLSKTNFASKQKIENESTLTCPCFVRITKHNRKNKSIASNTSNTIDNTGALSKKSFIENSDSVRNEICNYGLKQLPDSEKRFQFEENKDISAFLEENHLIHQSNYQNELSNIIASLFAPLSTEHNMKINPVEKNNSTRIECKNEIRNLKGMEKNIEINLTSPINLNIIKYNSLKRRSDSAVFYSHPTKKKTVVNSNSCEFTNAEDEFALLRSTALQNKKNAILEAIYSMSPKLVERIENLNKSYELINLWSYNCPNLESFITKKPRKCRSGIIKKKLNDQKLKEKAIVALRRMPEIDEMLKYGMKCLYDPLSVNSFSLKRRINKKTKVVIQPYKTIQKNRTKKKSYDNHENIKVTQSREFPIVLLNRIDISLFESKIWNEKPKMLKMDKCGFNYANSKTCECFKKNPIVMLKRIDLQINDKLVQKPPSYYIDGDIIDLTL